MVPFILIVFGMTGIITSQSDGYIFVNIPMTANDAEVYCHDTYGTNLASIHSAVEDSHAVQNCVSSDGCWIGLNDKVYEAAWFWNDHSLFNYSNWNVGEPNNKDNEDCVEISYAAKKWNDVPCDSDTMQKAFFCNKYIYVDLAKNADDAEIYCREQYGTNLASIPDSFNNGLAKSACLSDPCWIGSNNKLSEASWVWNDHSLFDYTNWDDGEPNNNAGNEHCGMIYSNGSWNDGPCDSNNDTHKHYFLCNAAGSPTAAPTRSPTHPTTSPTPAPTTAPTSNPTVEPTAEPTTEPTSQPTNEPTAEPTKSTTEPTSTPTNEPTKDTNEPTPNPTTEPTTEPTNEPTAEPTTEPTSKPTNEPTSAPTNEPTSDPTNNPTSNPTYYPTVIPTTIQTAIPTMIPTITPTWYPTDNPTSNPTIAPNANIGVAFEDNSLFIVAVTICIILGLMLILCFLIFCKLFYKNKKKDKKEEDEPTINIHVSSNDTPSTNIEDYNFEMTELPKAPSLPNMNVLTPGLSQQDSLNIEGDHDINDDINDVNCVQLEETESRFNEEMYVNPEGVEIKGGTLDGMNM